jgi:Holliday junction resolvasome RuvABC endonuclease subunit
MSVLALDLATTTGYAVLNANGTIDSGSKKFGLLKADGAGVRYKNFRCWLVAMKLVHEITEIVYEQTMGHTLSSPQIYCGLVAVVQMFGEHHQIPYRSINVSTVKKAFTGHGRADKAAMIAKCVSMGFRPQDDNEADALALLHVALDIVPQEQSCN